MYENYYGKPLPINSVKWIGENGSIENLNRHKDVGDKDAHEIINYFDERGHLLIVRC